MQMFDLQFILLAEHYGRKFSGTKEVTKRTRHNVFSKKTTKHYKKRD